MVSGVSMSNTRVDELIATGKCRDVCAIETCIGELSENDNVGGIRASTPEDCAECQ